MGEDTSYPEKKTSIKIVAISGPGRYLNKIFYDCENI
jgi:hypothetical protein